MARAALHPVPVPAARAVAAAVPRGPVRARLLALLVAATLPACAGRGAVEPQGAGAGAGSGAAAADTCGSTRFAQAVWAPVIGTVCYGCHLEGGLAPQSGSRFVLVPADRPDYIDANLAAVRQAAANLVDGIPSLLAKPTLQVPHGGGKVLDPDGDAYAALENFLANGALTGGCSPQVDAAALAALTLRSEADTVLAAATTLGGRRPTPAELAQATAGDLTGALASVLTAPGFVTYAKTVYNDVFLANRFSGDNLISFVWNVMGMPYWYPNDLFHGVVMAWPMAQNNLELIGHIIQADRSYAEILTADYRMVNPYSACGLAGAGHGLKFTQPCTPNGGPVNACTNATFYMALSDCPEFVPAQITNPAFGSPPPVVGVLSDPALWTVYSTTSTNRNRHRAAMLYETFLGLDILSLGPQLPPGSSAGADPNGPPATMTQPACLVCHKLIDPMAGTLQHFDVTGTYRTDAPWYADMLPPGFEAEPLPAGSRQEPVSWLADRIVADPRFAYGGVKLWYAALSGRSVLPDPAQNDPQYLESMRAKLAQNAFLWDQADQFRRDGLNVRRMVARLLASPYLRATGTGTAATPAQAQQLAVFDHLQRVYPETMDTVVTGTLGGKWFYPPALANGVPTAPVPVAGSGYLTGIFRVAAGGIDSQAAITRNNDMSTVAAAIAAFMAGALPCQRVAVDFERPQAQRLFFPVVNVGDTAATPAGEAAVRQNLAYLHALLLREVLAPGDPEIDADLALFEEVRAHHAGQTALAGECRGAALTSDPTQTLVGWSAVLGLLMQDSQFLYQ